MAYWRRKGKFGRVYVYTRYKDGEYQTTPIPIPRAQLSHLDPLDDTQVEQWVRQWEERWERNKKFQPTRILFSDELISAYLDKYLAYLLKYRAESTAYGRVSNIRRYAVPYFLAQNPPLKDPQQWVAVSVRFLEHLEQRGLSWSVMAAVNTDLRGFYKFLIEEGIVQHGKPLVLRFPKKTSEDLATPLPRVVRPDELLVFIGKQSDARVRLMGLLGYFFSLRPQETFGLTKGDFIAKKETIESLDCISHMARAGLYARFAVHVDRQRTNKGKLVDPKAGSRGHVACFNPQAAELIVAHLKEIEKGAKLFRHQNRHLFHLWDTAGLDLTLKDLRRSSLRYLGMETAMGDKPLHLRDHARHEDFNTTLLYLRATDTEAKDSDDEDELDLTS